MTSGGRIADAPLGRKTLFALIALAAVGAGIAIGLTAKGAIWEGWVTDRLFQVRAMLTPGRKSAPAPVVVVGLDQTALNSERLAPIPRVLMTPVMAEAGQAVLDAGARALGYDFVFAYSADAFADPGTGEARLKGFDQPFQRFLYRNRGNVFIAHTEVGVPHRSFSAAAGAGGVRSVTVTAENDGVVRRHSPEFPLTESSSLIDALIGAAGFEVTEAYTTIPSARLAVSIPYLSLLDVLKMQETETGRQDLRRFVDGRIVLFGGLLPYEDEHLYSDRFLPRTPADLSETGASGRPRVQSYTAGVFILADLIGAALSDRMAVAPAAGTLPALASVFSVAGTAAGLLLPLVALPFVAVGGILVGLGASLVGLEAGVLLSPGVAPVACVSAIIVSGIGKVGILQRRQRSLVRLFGHYLAPDVISRMAQSEQLPELGGDTRNVVVAFIDIVGFTKMSEKLADRDVVRVVNSCFDAIGQEITAHHGYIDKYIGDAIMAVWNAPNTVEHPEQAAVDAAREIIGKLDHIREITGQPPLDLRIALNAGPVLVGDIGGEHRRSFTVMGTTVNTASRIESVAKDQKVRLAVSQSVAEKLPGSYPVREIWSGQLRGLSSDISVFTLDVPEMYMEPSDTRPVSKDEQDRSKLLNFPR
ncbi:adenylate/guanylate cyclase domain-containing protein [Labrenzia sp. 011]|uniref:adenylate/guanylate cyclase domain-containing protein n=1 Tax=Labrenzia sp. 011 TaxID=2171494 RepID=UPI000D51B196|nr:adenylate/guanylate cyclase domain-containing protein [Labrenzia sp. 011]PVB63574.1 adenylate/guanylate cyclase domain-containing protein [Labrenzia sp. 011]